MNRDEAVNQAISAAASALGKWAERPSVFYTKLSELGYVVLPYEPTEEMIRAIFPAGHTLIGDRAYRAARDAFLASEGKDGK